MKYKSVFLPNWLQGQGKDKDIVISSRVRLARNLAPYPFPHKMNDDEKKKVLEDVKEVIEKEQFQEEAEKMNFFRLKDIEQIHREFLLEKHLISPNMLKDYIGRGLVLSKDENTSILINEEDHLRIQSFMSGFNLAEAYMVTDTLDDALEVYLSYAFHEKYGYLTACPTNIGTGIRFSVMVHLPGLSMVKQLDQIQGILRNTGCIIRGFFGEGSEGVGHLYQISNQVTIGQRERDILKNFEAMIEMVITKEKEARSHLFKIRPDEIKDLVYRAYGTIKYAQLLTGKEAMSLLSYLRLGLAEKMEFQDKITYRAVNSLIVLEQPGALQLYFKEEMSPGERDKKRPILFREIFKMTEKGGNKHDMGSII